LLSLRRKDEEIPADRFREKFLQSKWNFGLVPSQWEMRYAKAYLSEVRKQSPAFVFAEGKGDGAFRAICAVMNEIVRFEVTPARLEKIAIVQVPNLWATISSNANHSIALQCGTIAFPISEARQDLEQDSHAHIEHDPQVVVKTAFMVEHDNGSAIWL